MLLKSTIHYHEPRLIIKNYMKNTYLLLVLLFVSSSLHAQGVWTAVGCTAADPKISKVFVNACYNPEGYNEFVYMQTGSTPWNWSNFNVTGSNVGYTNGPNSGPPNNSPVANIFTANASIVAQLNAGVGPCPTPVFYPAPNPIPANSAIMVTMSSVGISGVSAGNISALCGKGPVYVISGNFISTTPATPTSGNFGFFKNNGCTSNPMICNISAIFNFGNGCAKTLTYNLNTTTPEPNQNGAGDGENFLEDGTQNISGCFDVPPCTAPPAPVLSPLALTFCNGQSTIPGNQTIACSNCTVSTAGFYNIFTTATGGVPVFVGPNFPSGYNIAGLPLGTTTFYATQTGFCESARIPITITKSGGPTNAISKVDANCAVAPGSGSVTVAASVTPSPYTYTWSNGGPNSPTITNLLPGTYTVTVTDANTCTKESTITVGSPPDLTMSVSGTTAATCVTPGTATVATTGGSPSFTYVWSTAGGNGATLSTLTPGTYTATATDSKGCTKTIMATIAPNTSIPTAVATAPNPLTCSNTSIGISGVGSSSGGYTYNWSGPTGITNGTTLTPTVTQIGTYTITVTKTSDGCTKTATVTVTEDKTQPVTAIATPPKITCANTSIQLNGNGSGAGTYSWSGPGIVSGGATLTPNVNVAGTYTLIVTSGTNGCTKAQTITVLEDKVPPSANAGPNKTLNCLNNQSTTLTASGGGTYVWSNSGTNATTTVNSPGTYTVIVTNPLNGCTQSSSVNVTTDITPPTVSPIPQVTITCGNASPSVNVSATGTNLQYNWSNGNSGNNTQVSSAGSYSVIVTNGNNGCTASQNFTAVEDKVLPTAVLAPPQQLTCSTGGSIVLDPTGSSSGANFGYLWSGPSGLLGSDPSGLTVTTPGSYCLNIFNNTNGCLKSVCTNVVGNVTPPTGDAGPPKALNCYNNSSVSIGTSGSGNQTYSWSSGPTPSNNTQTVTTAGVYTLTITNLDNGCTKITSVTVTDDKTAPVISPIPLVTVNCFTPMPSLNTSTVGSNLTYAWTPSGAGASPMITQGGTYTVVVTNSVNGCTDTKTIVVPEDKVDPLAVVATPPILNCYNNSSIALDPSGTSTGSNFTYNWSGPSFSSTNLIPPNVTAAGTYTLVVTNSTNGCTKDKTVNFTQNTTLPTALAGNPQTLNCFNLGTVNIGGASSSGANFTYLWSNGVTSATQNVTTPGTYTIVVTDTQNGCTKDANVVIGEDKNIPTVNVGVDLFINCYTPNVSPTTAVAGNGSPLTYAWTGTAAIASGANALIPSFNLAGTYTITVTNSSNGCTKTDVLDITSDVTLPTAVAAVSNGIDCNNTTATIDATGSSNGSNFTYGWTGPNGFTNSSINPTVTAGGVYTVMVTNTTNGCTKNAPVTVLEDKTPPAANAGGVQSVTCTNPTIQLNATGSVGANFSYNWTTTNGNIVSGTSSLVPTINQAGTYILVVTNNTTGCTATSTAVVNEDKVFPVANATGSGGLITCFAPTLPLGVNVTTGANLQYQWTASGGGNIVGNANQQNITVNQGGTYNVTITNATNGCSTTSSAAITSDNTPPIANATASGIIDCNNPNATLDGTSSSQGTGFSYNWTGPNGFSNNSSLQPTVTAGGAYTINVTNTGNGCVTAKTIVVNEDKILPSATIQTPNQLNCISSTVTIQASGSGSNLYSWTTANGNIVSNANTLTPTFDQPGLYTLNVINPTNGCQAAYSTTIISNIAYPTVTIEQPNPITCVAPNITLNALGSSFGSQYQIVWTANPGSILGGNGTLQPFTNQPGIYTLKITDSNNGCEKSQAVTIIDNRSFPTANANAISFEINCNNPVISLNANGSSSAINISYNWTSSTGTGFVSGQNTSSPQVNKGGTYTIVVTNTTNSCTASQSVAISENTTKPSVNAGPAKVITCTTATVQLQGNGSPGGQYTAQWSNSGGNIPNSNGGNTYTPTVSQVGVYTLTITNTQTGCTASATTNVTLDQGVPTANAGLQKEINCTVSSVQLDGTGSSSGAGLTFAWTTANGNFVSGQTTLTPTVNKFGIYKLKVTNTANNCTNEASVEVKDNTIKPTLKIAKPQLLNCANTNFTLVGTGSSTGNNFSYQWTTVGGNILSGDTTLIISLDKAGVYNLKITNKQNACVKDSSITVLDNFNKPVPAAAPTDLLTCVKPTAILDASASTNVQNTKIQWITPVPNAIVSGGNTLKPTINEAGDYKLILTDTLSQCKDSITFKVTKDANIPTANAGQTAQLNCTKNTITLAGTATASPTITYAWTTVGGNITTGQTTLTPTIDKAGTYTLKVSDAANQCVKEASVTITQDTVKPKIAIVKPQILDCKTTVMLLNASGSSTGKTLKLTWTTPAPFVSGGNSLTPNINKPGLYSLTIKDTVSTCTTTKSVLVEQDIVKPQAGIAKTDTLNCKNLAVKLKGSASSNSTFYNYAWKTPSNAFVKDSTTLSPTVDKAGNYQLVVTDTVNHCATTAQITIIKDVLTPIVDAGLGGNITCTVKEITLNGTATNGGTNLTYLWTTKNGNVLGAANALTAKADNPGTYFLAVENKVNFCKAIDSTVVTQDANVPIVSILANGGLNCKIKTLVLDGSGSSQGAGITFTWTTKNGGNIVKDQNTLNPTINSGGVYVLQINNTNNNCIKEIEKTIPMDTLRPTLINVTQDLITCKNPTTELNGKVFGVPNFTANWSTATGGIVSTKTDTLTIVANKKGIYNLKIKNTLNECEGIKEVKVLEDTTPPTVDCGPSLEINCKDSVLTLQGGKSSIGTDFIYTWTSNVANNVILGDKTLTPQIDKAGAYYLLIVNKGNGCQGKDTVNIKINKIIPKITTLKPDTLTCKKQQVTLNASSTATGKPVFAWTSGANTNILSSDKTQDKISVNRPGVYAIAVIDDKNQCKSNANITVVQDTIYPTANAGANIELNCKSPTIDVSGQATGQNLIYKWATSNGTIVANGDKAKVTVKSAGLYDFLVTNAFNGCTANDQMEVTFLGAPKAVVLAPEKLTCARTNVILDSKGSDIGTIYTYSWSDTNGSILGTNATLNTTQPGVYNFKVLNTTNDCEQKAQVKIEQDIVNPTAEAGSASTISCEKGYTILDATQSSLGAKYAYKWTGGIIESGATTTAPRVTAQATYSLLVTNTDNGCTATDSVGVISLKPAILTSSAKDPLCNGGKGQIEFKSIVGGTSPFKYSINGGKSYFPYSVFTNLKPDDYTAIVQDSKGCVDSTVLTINSIEKLKVNLENIIQVKIGDDVQIQATVTPTTPPLKKITWTPDTLLSCKDCLNPIVKLPKNSIYYKIKVINENGCEAEAYTTVEVNSKIPVFIPTSFSPNGDNINDRFIAFGDPDLVLKIKWMRVYDRWGEIVYSDTDINPNDTGKGWDGSFRNSPVNPAVYVWNLEVLFLDGTSKIFKGDVTLQR